MSRNSLIPSAGMDHLFADVRYGFRLMRKNLGFSTLAVLTLALGIGASTAIFSVFHGVLLEQLPYADQERVLRIMQQFLANGQNRFGISQGQFLAWRAEQRSFSELGAYSADEKSVVSGSAESERILSASVSAGVLEALGVRPIIGRTFNLQDEVPGGPRVTILTYAFWQRWFHGNRDIVGRQLRIDDQLYTVIGVLPVNFYLPEDFVGNDPMQLLTPLRIRTGNPNWGANYLQTVGHLKPGVSRSAALAEVKQLFERLWQEHPIGAAKTLQEIGWNINAVPILDDIVGDIRTALWILTGAVAVVLLVVCANVANLLLARASIRQKEIAVRAALGAQRMRIVRQLLVECLVISAFGGLFGLALAYGDLKLIVHLASSSVPRIADVSLNLPVLLYTAGISILAAVLFGLIPAFQSTRSDLNQPLRDEGRGTSAGASKGRTQRILVVAEMASAMVLVISAGLLLRSFNLVMRIDPGFNVDHLLTAQLDLPETRYAHSLAIDQFFSQVLGRVRTMPGVVSAAVTSNAPLTGSSSDTLIDVEGRPTKNLVEQHIYLLQVSSDYFKAMGIGFVRGRPFHDSDNADAPPVIIIDEALAHRYWPNEDPVGKHLRLYKTLTTTNGWVEIVGVVNNVPMRQLNEKHQPHVYMDLAQSEKVSGWILDTTLVVRTTSDPVDLANSIRRAVQDLDPSVPVSDVQTAEQLVGKTVSGRQFDLVLLELFAGIALALAAIGIYGVLANIVRQRTREIGIRMALGAQRKDVFRLILSQGMRPAILGVVVGLAAALLTTRLLSNLLFAIKPADPITFAAVPVLLLVVALLACYLPARRALRVDPMITLRYE